LLRRPNGAEAFDDVHLVRFGPHDPAQHGPFGGFAFDPTTGRYVWHCHILEHEDNDMIRPYAIVN
jgi:FtsP/CotA-like multicopper oxidase with cupredoxin domain